MGNLLPMRILQIPYHEVRKDFSTQISQIDTVRKGRVSKAKEVCDAVNYTRDIVDVDAEAHHD